MAVTMDNCMSNDVRMQLEFILNRIINDLLHFCKKTSTQAILYYIHQYYITIILYAVILYKIQ